MVKRSRRDDLHSLNQSMFTRIATSRKNQVIGFASVLAIGAGVYFSSFEAEGRYFLWNPIFGGSDVTCPHKS